MANPLEDSIVDKIMIFEKKHGSSPEFLIIDQKTETEMLNRVSPRNIHRNTYLGMEMAIVYTEEKIMEVR